MKNKEEFFYGKNGLLKKTIKNMENREPEFLDAFSSIEKFLFRQGWKILHDTKVVNEHNFLQYIDPETNNTFRLDMAFSVEFTRMEDRKI